MELSIFLAKIIGVVYVAVGIAMLLNPRFYEKLLLRMIKNREIMFVLALIGFVISFIWVLKHNVWHGWPILVSLFGWLAFIKTFFMLVFPDLFEEFSIKFLKRVSVQAWWGGFGLGLGILFSYLGWMA